MAAFAVRRLGAAALTIFLVVTITFAMAHLAPGEPMLADAVVQPQVHWRLGISLEKLGRRDEAIAHLEQAVALAPREQRYREKLAALRSGTSDGGDE